MTTLHRISDDNGSPSRGRVIFIHGLGGDAFTTWTANPEAFWPRWLAQDLQVDVYTLSYDASPSAWLGQTMPLFDRAKNVLTELETREIANTPLVFICHSLGGLVAKALLRQGLDKQIGAWRQIVGMTRALVFLSTPHAGARLAGYLSSLAGLLRLTVSVKELESHTPALRDLNEWYRNNARGLGIQTYCFYEKQNIGGSLIVDEGSADPGIEGIVPVPLDADHFGICKPVSREDLVYRRVRQIVQSVLVSPTRVTQSMSEPLSKARVAKRFFISYRRDASNDQELAGDISDALTGAGHDVFLDVKIKVGTDWASEIRHRIEWCDFFLILLSERSVQSEMVRDEVRLAHEIRTQDGRSRILPIRVNYDGPLGYDLDTYLGHLQYASWTSPSDSQRIVTEILDAIATNTDLTASNRSRSNSQLSFESSANSPRPKPALDPRMIHAPGGTLRFDDKFYIRRGCDLKMETAAQSPGETLIIKAPRQMGKSSLLVRYYAKCKELGRRTVYLDFQRIGDDQVDSYQTFLRAVANELQTALNIDSTDPIIKSSGAFTKFVEKEVLSKLDSPLTIALDEVDRLVNRPFHNDFFSMLRNWHNGRALPGSPWANVDLALVIATEPYLLINAADRSPFNVTPAIEIEPFSQKAVGELNRLYGEVLDRSEENKLFELLNGHPYLTRLSLFRLATQRMPFEEFLKRAHAGDGPFGEHLRSCLLRLNSRPELLGAMRQVIANGILTDQETYWRLHGTGLVTRDSRDLRATPANLLYARFFRSVLQ